MARGKKKESTSEISLILRVNGEDKQIADVDLKKYNLINYYIKQNNKNEGDFLANLADGIKAGFDKEIEKQYKKVVPKDVRSFYEGFMMKAEESAEDDADGLTAMLPSQGNNNEQQ